MIITARDHDLIGALLDGGWKRRLLADGDSWHSIGGVTGNLLMAIDDADTLIVNCAYPGDELADSCAIGGDDFAWLLDTTDGMPAWDAVLLSAGGNDVIKVCARFVVKDASGHHIDRDAMHAVLDDFERQLIRFVRLARAAQPGVPVFCHTYDYPPVARRWWWWHLGPWIAPVLAANEIHRSEWHLPVAVMIDSMAERMHNVAADWPELHVVDTRHMLAAADWRNEIHPSVRGYHVLGRRWRAELNAVLNPGETP